MDQVATFFHMGGYGLFVWPCFVLSAAVLLALYLQSYRKLKAVEQELAMTESRRAEKRARSMSSAARNASHDT